MGPGSGVRAIDGRTVALLQVSFEALWQSLLDGGLCIETSDLPNARVLVARCLIEFAMKGGDDAGVLKGNCWNELQSAFGISGKVPIVLQ